MNKNHWSKKISAVVSGAMAMGILSFIATSNAQNPFVKLVMRFGEERTLEDGTRVGVSKGEGDFIVVTISKPVSFTGTDIGTLTAKPTASTSGLLKLGTYKARGVSETITSGIGSGIQSTVPLKIKIRSINSDNNVEAEFIRNGQVGRMKGRIDATGKLQLEGYLDASFGVEWHVSLTASIENKVLTGGKYTMTASVEVKGTFPTSELEDDN